MKDFAAIITNPLGISNFEFTESGLLKALQQFLTVTPSQSLNDLEIESMEEAKQNKSQHKTKPIAKRAISKKDAKCLILRLKIFAHVMCHEISAA